VRTLHIHSVNPCHRCVHLPECEEFLLRIDEALGWVLQHHAGYDPPQVIIDCEGRYSPESRTRPLEFR